MITLGDVLVKLTGSDKALRDTLSGAERLVKGFGQRIGNTLNQAFTFALGGVIERGLVSITNGIQGMARTAFDSVAANERLVLSLESLVAGQLRAGDATISMSQALAAAAPMARELLGWINELAIKSPFSQEGVATAFRTAQSYGFNTVMAKRLTQATIDMAAATGAGTEAMQRINLALGQIRSKGKTSAEELGQLREAGAPVQQALDSLGVTLDDVSKGLVSADDFIEAIVSTMEGSFAGAAERQSLTWAGLASTFGDITRINLRSFFEGILTPLQPLVARLADLAGSADVTAALTELGQAIGDVVQPAFEWLASALEFLPAKFRDAANFIRQLRDELAGLTAGDILGELPGQLAAAQEALNTSLATLAQAHQGTLQQLQEDIKAAGETMAAGIAEVTQKYAPKIVEIADRYAKSIRSIQERITDEAETAAKKRADIEARILKTQSDFEEKLTEMKRSHEQRRRQLSLSLLTAESEEAWLSIKEQIAAEDEKFNEQTASAKEAAAEQKSTLEEQLKEQDVAYAKSQARLERALQEERAERQKALNEVFKERDTEIAKVKETHQAAIDSLNARIQAENESYQQQQADLKASTAEQLANLEAVARARAAALGQGLPAEIAAQIRAIIDGYNTASTAIQDFISQALGPLTTGFASLRDQARSTWEYLRETVPGVLETIKAETKPALDLLSTWWEEHGATVRTLVALNWDTLKSIVENAITALVAAVRLGLALLRGDWEAAGQHLETIFQANWDTISTIFGNALTGLKTVTGDTIETIVSLFTERDWLAIGKSIYDGIAEGFTGAAKNLKDKAVEGAGDFLTGVKNFFRIKSPSELFKTEVGEQLAAGMGAGFESGMERVVRMAQQAMAGITPGSLAPAAAGAGVAGGAAGSGIVLNLSYTIGSIASQEMADKVVSVTKQDVYDILLKFAEGKM